MYLESFNHFLVSNQHSDTRTISNPLSPQLTITKTMKFLATAVALASNAGAAAIGRNPPTCPSKYVLKTEPLPGSANLLHSGLYL